MNEANKALSRIALVLLDEPPGELTKMWQVMSREFNITAVEETTSFSVVLVGGGLGAKYDAVSDTSFIV